MGSGSSLGLGPARPRDSLWRVSAVGCMIPCLRVWAVVLFLCFEDCLLTQPRG